MMVNEEAAGEEEAEVRARNMDARMDRGWGGGWSTNVHGELHFVARKDMGCLGYFIPAAEVGLGLIIWVCAWQRC